MRTMTLVWVTMSECQKGYRVTAPRPPCTAAHKVRAGASPGFPERLRAQALFSLTLWDVVGRNLRPIRLLSSLSVGDRSVESLVARPAPGLERLWPLPWAFCLQ